MYDKSIIDFMSNCPKSLLVESLEDTYQCTQYTVLIKQTSKKHRSQYHVEHFIADLLNILPELCSKNGTLHFTYTLHQHAYTTPHISTPLHPPLTTAYTTPSILQLPPLTLYTTLTPNLTLRIVCNTPQPPLTTPITVQLLLNTPCLTPATCHPFYNLHYTSHIAGINYLHHTFYAQILFHDIHTYPISQPVQNTFTKILTRVARSEFLDLARARAGSVVCAAVTSYTHSSQQNTHCITEISVTPFSPNVCTTAHRSLIAAHRKIILIICLVGALLVLYIPSYLKNSENFDILRSSNRPNGIGKLSVLSMFFMVLSDDNLSDTSSHSSLLLTPTKTKHNKIHQSPTTQDELLHQGTGTPSVIPLDPTETTDHPIFESLNNSRVSFPQTKESKSIRTPVNTRSRSSPPATPPRRKNKMNSLANHSVLSEPDKTNHKSLDNSHSAPHSVIHDLPSSCPLHKKKNTSAPPIYQLNKTEKIYLDRLQKCPVSLEDGYLNAQASSTLYTYLDSNIPFSQFSFLRGERIIKQHREHFWIGNAPLHTGGITLPPSDPRNYPSIREMFKDIEKYAFESLGKTFVPNGVLLTKLRDGNDSFEYHDDYESIFGPNPSSITILLKGTRLLIFRKKSGRQQTHFVTLKSGSILHMGGESSRHYEHNIPKYSSDISCSILMSFKEIESSHLHETPEDQRTSDNLITDIPPINVQENITSHNTPQNSTPGKSQTSDSDMTATSNITKPSVADLKNAKLANKMTKKKMADCLDITQSDAQLAIENLEKDILRLNNDNIALHSSMEIICSSKPTKPTCPLAATSLLHSARLEYLEDKVSHISNELQNLGETVESELSTMTLKLNKQSTIIQEQSLQLTNLLQINKNMQERIAGLEQQRKNNPNIPEQPAPQNPVNPSTSQTHAIEDLTTNTSIATKDITTEQPSLYSDVTSSITSMDGTHQPRELNHDVHQDRNIGETNNSHTSNQTFTTNHGPTPDRNTHRTTAPSQNNPHNSRPPPEHTHNRGRRKPRVLILSDSRINNFEPDKFSTSISVEKDYAGSYDNAERFLRNYTSKPGIDAYVLDLGINDLRNISAQSTMTFAKNLVDRLLIYTKGKVVISLVLPTTRNTGLNKKVIDFNYEMLEYIRYLRNTQGLHHRIFTVFNKAFLGNSDIVPEDLYSDDGLHLSDKGLRIHCSNIKHAVFKSLNINVNHQTRSQDAYHT